MPLSDNLGECPSDAKGKRVRVVLRCGYDTLKVEPNGWAADERGGCDWRLRGHPYDIVSWEIIG